MPVQQVYKEHLAVQPIDWCGLHRKYLNALEMEIITTLVRGVEARVMTEIGCRDGRTARVLLSNVASLERYIGIDVPMSYEPRIREQRSETVSDPGYYASIDPRFELIISEHGSLDLDQLEACDAVFIDGDHSSEVVRHDSDLARASVRPGGIIIFHDYHNNAVEVTRVLDSDARRGHKLFHIEGTWLAFERR